MPAGGFEPPTMPNASLARKDETRLAGQLLRMPLRSPAISAAPRGPSTPRASAEWSRARCLGHRLHAEMTLAVDPALSLADSSKLADEIKGQLTAALPH